MTAKLASTLTHDRLAPGVLEDENDLNAHGLAHRQGFLLFDGQTYKPSFFHRELGINLSNGDIHLGGASLNSLLFTDSLGLGLVEYRARISARLEISFPGYRSCLKLSGFLLAI